MARFANARGESWHDADSIYDSSLYSCASNGSDTGSYGDLAGVPVRAYSPDGVTRKPFMNTYANRATGPRGALL